MTCFIYTATPQEKQKWVDIINKVSSSFCLCLHSLSLTHTELVRAQTLNEYREESKLRPLLAPRGTQRNSLFTKKRTSVGPTKGKTIGKSSGGAMSGSPPADSSVLSAAHAKEDAKEESTAEQDTSKSPRVTKEQDDAPAETGGGGDKSSPSVATPEPFPSSSSDGA
jgi:hypothetical protein